MSFRFLPVLSGHLLRVLSLAVLCISLAQAQAPARNLGVSSTTKRVALVIGNGAYKHPDILPKLSNPTHDAEDIAKALRGFGFEVIERKDQSLEGMNSAIAEFSRKIGNSDAALFYFAGHGLQLKGQNYLIPVDANIETEARVQYVSVNVNQILDEMDSAKSRVNIVMLDACRNNPISGKFRSGATRGLAAPSSQPKGTVIVYATDPGNVAADGEGRNGLFTSGLLTAFKGGDLSLAGVLLRASAEVERGSDQKQTPYINGPATLQQSFQFAAGTQVASLTPQFSGARTREQIEDELWDAIKDGDRASVFEEYLKQYPKGRYLAQAKVKIAKLKAEARQPAVPPAPTSVAVASSDPETQFWNEVKTSGSREYLDAYLKQYPRGKYVALAKVELKKLGDKEKAERVKQEAERKGARATEDAESKAAAERDAAERARQEAARQGKETTQMRPGKVFKDCADCPDMVIIPAGNFEMGSNEIVAGHADWDKWGKPVHTVRIGKPFALAKTEVTQGQWKSVMGSNPSYSSNCGDNCPVEKVSWHDAKIFIQKLNAKTGKTYRLPSEAEWEYACRAGGTHTYCGGDSIESVAWYDTNSGSRTHAVAGKQANAWGLYDMSGNVQEWTEDCLNENYSGAPTDGSAWTKGNCGLRVFRGGSWNVKPQDVRSASRGWLGSTLQDFSIGFRPARVLP